MAHCAIPARVVASVASRSEAASNATRGLGLRWLLPLHSAIERLPLLSIGLSEFMSFGCHHSRCASLDDRYHKALGQSSKFLGVRLGNGFSSSGAALSACLKTPWSPAAREFGTANPPWPRTAPAICNP